jgi:hypothetical protein
MRGLPDAVDAAVVAGPREPIPWINQPGSGQWAWVITSARVGPARLASSPTSALCT